MTKGQTRLFFYAGTLVFAAIFVGLTIHSHMRFGELTNSDMITEEVIEGKHVWHVNNCVNCHTLLGEGAYYAPDLTKITDLRGETYLRAFLREPSRFYSEEEDRRLMPNPQLTEEEITQVIAFLEWVSNIDNQGWPPRPIRVTGALPGAYGGDRPTGPASDDPVSVGEALMRASPPGCVACHSTAPGIVLAGPSLAGMASRAAEIVQSPDYQGAAETAEAYVREAILQPSAHIVDDPRFTADGMSLMPPNYGETLEPSQIEALVAYLLTLR